MMDSDFSNGDKVESETGCVKWRRNCGSRHGYWYTQNDLSWGPY